VHREVIMGILVVAAALWVLMFFLLRPKKFTSIRPDDQKGRMGTKG
jgi:hypothetical protein